MLFIIPLNAHTQGSLKNLSGHIDSRDTSYALSYTVYILCIKSSNLRITINFHILLYNSYWSWKERIHFLLLFLKKLQRLCMSANRKHSNLQWTVKNKHKLAAQFCYYVQHLKNIRKSKSNILNKNTENNTLCKKYSSK